MIRVAVAGAAGRMGETVCTAVEGAEDMELTGRADPQLGTPVADVLEPVGPRPAAGVASGARAAAVAQSLRLRAGAQVPTGPVLLVDDVSASGWTDRRSRICTATAHTRGFRTNSRTPTERALGMIPANASAAASSSSV